MHILAHTEKSPMTSQKIPCILSPVAVSCHQAFYDTILYHRSYGHDIQGNCLLFVIKAFSLSGKLLLIFKIKIKYKKTDPCEIMGKNIKSYATTQKSTFPGKGREALWQKSPNLSAKIQHGLTVLKLIPHL